MLRPVLRRPAIVLAAGLGLWGCSRRAPIGSCDDDLGGVYRPEGGDRGARWMVLDRGAKLEVYPLFADADGPPDLVAAPRMIELARPAVGVASGAAGRTGLEGTLRRRYMRRAQRCDARVPVHVTRCAGDTLELVLADAVPPVELAPCTWPAPAPSRLERWRRADQ